MTNVSEIFLPVKGYEGLYEVSNLGTVKTIQRTIVRKSKHSAHIFPIYTKIKTATISKNGYCTIALVREGKTKNTYLHRIIAEAHIPNPNNYRCVNHKNGIKTDNRIENLEWCNHAFNNKHALDTFLRIPNGTLKINQVKEIILLRKQNLTYKKIGELLSISKGTVGSLISGKSYKRLRALHGV